MPDNNLTVAQAREAVWLEIRSFVDERFDSGDRRTIDAAIDALIAAVRAEAVHPDTARLDWLADEPIFDGLGDLDIHEVACDLAGGVEVSPEKMRDCYHKAMRVLIDGAMSAHQTREGE